MVSVIRGYLAGVRGAGDVMNRGYVSKGEP